MIRLCTRPSHRLDRQVIVTTAGAPPSPTIIGRMSELGARIVHVYGLTETYGPYTVCEIQDDWTRLDPQARNRMMAHQGVGMLVTDGVRVVAEDMTDIPRDGAAIGEVVMRGNNVMSGYFDDPEATEKAFRGGWFHSGASVCGIQTATPSYVTGPRTSSFPAVRTSPPLVMRPVVFDTDIGTDVDDILALVFLAKAPELKLLGVTTVYGDTNFRAKIAKATTHLSGWVAAHLFRPG